MSNFSFSHSVFKRLVSQGRQKVSLCGNGLNQSPPNLVKMCMTIKSWMSSRMSELSALELENFLFSYIFSSSEHEVLRVSYCDSSVVRLSGWPSVHPSVHLFTITKKKIFSSPKPTIRFQSNFTEMILRSCSFKILQRIEFREELWLPWEQSEKTLNIFLSQTVRARAFIFGM